MTDYADISQESAREAVANVAMALRDIGLQLRGANPNVAAETCYDEWAIRLERACAQLDAAPGLWECEKCGFAFSREHENEGGGYSCPVCELATADKAIDALRVRVAAAEQDTATLRGALNDFSHAAHAVLHGASHVGWTLEHETRARHQLAVLAGRYDLPSVAAGVPHGTSGAALSGLDRETPQ